MGEGDRMSKAKSIQLGNNKVIIKETWEVIEGIRYQIWIGPNKINTTIYTVTKEEFDNVTVGEILNETKLSWLTE